MTITNKVSLKSVNGGNTPIADVPDAPTIGAVSDPGTGTSASVAFTVAATGGAVTTFTATSTPESLTGTSATSPITVTGLTTGTSYTFKVKGANSTATGPESSASSSFAAAAPLAFDSIASFSIATATSTVTFTSIPTTYKHLQLRVFARRTAANNFGSIIVARNGSYANYNRHYLTTDGTTASAGATLSTSTDGTIQGITGAAQTANYFGAAVVDILDFQSTVKNKNALAFSGASTDGVGGGPFIVSSEWRDATAVTSLEITTSDFAQYSHIALYGIKG